MAGIGISGKLLPPPIPMGNRHEVYVCIYVYIFLSLRASFYFSVALCLQATGVRMLLFKDIYPTMSELECGECERIYVPICATNNRTFVNMCKLYCYNQGKRKEDRARYR